MKYLAFLFDLDGTLLNTLEDIAQALNRNLVRYGLPPRTLAEVRAFVGNGSARLVELAVSPEAKDRAPQILADYRADYDKNCNVLTRPYDGVLEVMRRLADKNIPMAVVSNKPDAAVKSLAAAHFPGLLQSAMGEGAKLRRKPAPDTVLAAMAQMGVTPEKTVYVGDSEVDIATAKNAGLDCISVCWGFRDREALQAAGADVIISSPEELLEFI